MGGQANLGNARIFTAFVAATPPLPQDNTLTTDVGPLPEVKLALRAQSWSEGTKDDIFGKVSCS